jgi:Flp pilus assembly pilin Flp
MVRPFGPLEMTVKNLDRRFVRGKRRINRLSAACSDLITRIITEDDGQDMVEYALLAAFIGIAGWAVLMTLPGAMETTYKSWLNPTDGVPGKWDPPPPTGS